MAIGGDNAGHQRYAGLANEQREAVNSLRQAYSELAEQQQADAKRIAGAQDDVNRSLAEGQDEVRGLGGGFDGLASSLGKMKGQLAALAVAAAAVQQAIKFVGDETARLDNIAKSAQKSGLGFEAYQRLQHVATLSGTSIESVGKASLKLNLNLREIADGGGKQAARALEQLGLSADDLAGLSETEQFAAIAGQLELVGDESTKSALAFELFGKSGTELIPMLNAGADGVREMSDAVGGVFTREQLAAAEAYQDSLANLNRSIDMAKGELAAALAPEFQRIAESITRGTGEISKYIPMLIKYFEGIMRGIEPALRYVQFFAEQMAILGRVMEVGEGVMERAGDRMREFGETLAETEAGKWATDAKDMLIEMADAGIASITDAAKEHIPFADDIADAWQTISYAIGGATAEAQQFGAIAKGRALLGDLLGKAKDAGVETAEARERELAALQKGVSEAEHAVRLAEAQKAPAAELERLYQRQHARRLELLLTTGDIAKLEAEMANEEIRQARARASRRGGGSRGPSDAERMQADGEAQLQQWQARLRLMELEAELGGRAGQEAAYLADVRHNLAMQELELQRQVLEVTRAKNDVERQQRDTKIAVVEASMRELELEQQLAEQERARADAAAWRDEWVATQEREAALASNVIELEDYRAEQRIRELEAEGRLGEAAELRIQQAQRRAEQAQAEIELRRELLLLEDPETEGERIRQQMQLEQLAHEQRMAIAQRDSEVSRLQNAERQRLHELEIKRKQEAWRNAQQIASASEGLTRQSLSFASYAVDAMIKDEDKREKAKLKVEGAMTMAVAARSQVEAIAAFASFNYLQGALHQAAAAFGFIQGGMMLAGIVPGGGSAGAAAAAPAPAAPRERETSAAAVTPDSVPAADRGPRTLGGAGANDEQSGATIININGFVGDLSDEGAETLARRIRDSRYAAGDL